MHLLLTRGGAIPPANTAPRAVIPLPHFSVLISIHTLQISFPLLPHTIESTLHTTFVASSKMLISGNQETVCWLLITSDCTAHYASEVNYQQNEGKMGPQSRSSSHQFSTCGVALTSYLSVFILSSFVHLDSLFTKAPGD